MQIEDLILDKGATFERTIFWGIDPLIFKSITVVPSALPLQLTVPAHGVPDGYPVTFAGFTTITGLNAKYQPVAANDYRYAKVIDADTIEIDGFNGTGVLPYKGGAFVQYSTPKDLTGFTAKFQVFANLGDAEPLLELDIGTGIAIDIPNSKISLTIEQTAIAAFNWTQGFFRLYMTSPDGTVTRLLGGAICVVQ